mmetsp:Transcript_42186/g.98466  ORF Transcript_42186/g.98466 Transcript_42186/m.98466 type:complete len:120 (+) Transcript_42186:1242-1601(+)
MWLELNLSFVERACICCLRLYGRSTPKRASLAYLLDGFHDLCGMALLWDLSLGYAGSSTKMRALCFLWTFWTISRTLCNHWPPSCRGHQRQKLFAMACRASALDLPATLVAFLFFLQVP